ncbi:MAG: cyclic nucleotide-binding domain-containing protein [Deltaproteobacteria bacterium]|nr:cyclic nucleotide-binding domain-containing protein [Deltaproteobacteria bacterium]
MGGIVGEIEFEFTQEAGGGGRFVPTGKVVGQIAGYLSRGDVAAAARLYQGCGPEVAAELFRETRTSSAKLRGAMLEMFVQARDFGSAARCAELVDDAGRAAQLFETAYDFARAAALYEKAGDLAKAALMYEKTLDFQHAGHLYLKLGDLARAAENLERGGDALGAARLYLKAGNWKRAGTILHDVPSNRGEFFEAGTMLAEILWRTGHRDLAVAKLVEVVRAFPTTPDVADLYYRLGEMFADLGRVDHASAAYERVDSIRPGFRDARQKAQEMRRLSQLPPAPAGDAGPAPLDLGTEAGASSPDEKLQYVDPDLESLRDLPLFRELEHEELAELFRLGGRITLAAGKPILRTGEPGRGLFVVREGEVEVVQAGSGRVLAVLHAGEHFGEMSLLDNAPVSADVRAKTAVVLIGIPREEFARFLYLNERVAGKVYRHFAVTLAKRLSDANAKAGPGG